jgi:hypothetical protein
MKSSQSPKTKRHLRVDGVYDGVRAKVIVAGLAPSL